MEGPKGNNMKDETKKLIDKMAETVQGERNRYNAQFWQEQPPYGRMYYRGVPKRSKDGPRPFVVEPDISLWAKILDFSVYDFFHDPEVYLNRQIQMNLHKSELFKDNTYFTGEITPYPGVVFELSLFGVECVFHKDTNPWINPEPILQDYEDLEKLEKPDFYTSGLMPRVHEFYERFQEMAGDTLMVVFPDWLFSPFGIAVHLRGLTNLLVDLLVHPEWVHKLLSFITESHKEWIQERAKFLNQEIGKAKLFNDEVDCPVISPENYRDLILPHELELEKFHSGILYFHSCGNLSKLLPEIRKIKSLEMLHLGPWTDLTGARDLFGEDTVFDICLEPINDVLKATDTDIHKRIGGIQEIFSGDYGYSIRADALQKMGEHHKEDYQKIIDWCNTARKACGQEE